MNVAVATLASRLLVVADMDRLLINLMAGWNNRNFRSDSSEYGIKFW